MLLNWKQLIVEVCQLFGTVSGSAVLPMNCLLTVSDECVGSHLGAQE